MTSPTVLGKTLAVLRAFTADDVTLRFAELQRRTTLPKATLHRLLGDLVEHRLLDRVDGEYRLSGLVFELGMRASVGRGLIEVATPFLEDLYERTHETVHLGVREGAEVVYVAKVGGHRQAPSPSRLGGRDHRGRDRAGRRRHARQGDHRPQPGRPAPDHARHRAVPRRRRHRAPDEQVLAAEITSAVEAMVKTVAAYVPGYRLNQAVQVRPVPDDQPLPTLIGDASHPTHQVSVFLEVEGAAHYLPAYAGNLDIMTSAALRVGEELASRSAR